MIETVRAFLDGEPRPGLRLDLEPLDPDAVDREPPRIRYAVLGAALVATLLLVGVAAIANPGKSPRPVEKLLSPAGLVGLHVSILRGARDATGPVVPPLAGPHLVTDDFSQGEQLRSWRITGHAATETGTLALAGAASLDPGSTRLLAEVVLAPKAPAAGITFLGDSSSADRWAWLSEPGVVRLVRTYGGVSRTIFSTAVTGRPTRLTVEVAPDRFTVAADGLDYASVSMPLTSARRIGIETEATAGVARPVATSLAYEADR